MRFQFPRDSDSLSKCVEKHKKNGKHDWVGIANEMNLSFEPLNFRQWNGIYYSEVRKGPDGLTGNQRRAKNGINRANQIKRDIRLSSKTRLSIPPKDPEGLIMQALLSAPKTAAELAKVIQGTEIEALGYIERIRANPIYQVKVVEAPKGTSYCIDKLVRSTDCTFDFDLLGKKDEITFMAVSDSHIGCKEEQLTFIKDLYKYAKARGIGTIFHSGDLTDGFYKSRPEQIYELVPTAVGFDGQAQRVIDHYPMIDGITTYFITGNHDDTHIKNGGANIGRKVAECRKDMVYLGQNNAYFKLGGITIELFHPGGGSAYSLSYKPQKGIEFMNALPKNEVKPDLVLQGHFHKTLYLFQSDIHYFLVPSLCGITQFEREHIIWNITGAWVITVKTGQDGKIAAVIPEYIKEPCFLKDDWMNYD